MKFIDGCESLYSGDGMSDDVDLATFPTPTKTHPPSQTVTEAGTFPVALIPVDQNHGDSSANHTLSIILGTVIPTVALAASAGIGKGCDWLDRNRPGEYMKSKKWMRRVGFVFWIIAKVIKYLKNIEEMADSNDPEAVPMVGDHQGHVNDLFAISYKTE